MPTKAAKMGTRNGKPVRRKTKPKKLPPLVEQQFHDAIDGGRYIIMIVTNQNGKLDMKRHSRDLDAAGDHAKIISMLEDDLARLRDGGNFGA